MVISILYRIVYATEGERERERVRATVQKTILCLVVFRICVFRALSSAVYEWLTFKICHQFIFGAHFLLLLLP